MPPTSAKPESDGQKKAVDWVEFFGGKAPTEIITIHDDDSPAPPTRTLRPAAPSKNTPAQQPGKKRRTNAGNEKVSYSNTNTPYSLSHGPSTESLTRTTAPTSLGSQVSAHSRLDATQTGQKRKRGTRTSEPDRKKQEVEPDGVKGYLAQYQDYIPPPKQAKKQKDVHVPAIHEVCDTAGDVILRAEWTDQCPHSDIKPRTRLTTKMVTISSRKAVIWASVTNSSSCWVRALLAKL